MVTDGAPDPKNGVIGLLNTLAASGDNWVKFGTLALVVVTGGGNWLATQKTAESNYDHIQAARTDTRNDILKAVQETHQIHDALEETVQRQKEMHEMLLKLTKASPSPAKPVD